MVDNSVTPASLAPLQAAAQAWLNQRYGISHLAQEIIPYAFEAKEQIAFIERVAGHLRPDDRVSFDITFSFRHLPLLSVTAAAVVHRLQGAVPAGIWYGAHDHPRTRAGQPAPVIRLDGLDHINQWLTTLPAYDADGGSSRFVPLMRRDGLSHKAATLLQEADFLELIGDLEGAAAKLRAFEASGWRRVLTGPRTLFAETLAARIGWARASDAYGHLRQAALGALARQDVLTCARFAHEAALTRITARLRGAGAALNRDQRKIAHDAFRKDKRREQARARQAFIKLTRLRNVLVLSSYLTDERRGGDGGGQSIGMPRVPGRAHDNPPAG